jgi:hypothetical protein
MDSKCNMIFKFLSVTLLLGGLGPGSTARASTSLFGPGDLSPIEADYSCEGSEGGGMAFALPTAELPNGRLWQSDEGNNEGAEFQVTSFKSLECDKCYEISANAWPRTIAKVVTRMDGNKMMLKLSYIEDRIGGREQPLGDYPCKPVKK